MTEIAFYLFIALVLLYMGWLVGEYTATRRNEKPTTPPPSSHGQRIDVEAHTAAAQGKVEQRPSHMLTVQTHKLPPLPIVDIATIQRERDRTINLAIVQRHSEHMKPQPRQGNNLN